MVMVALCAFQVLLFGSSVCGVFPPTSFKWISADVMITMAWGVALLGWDSARRAEKDLKRLAAAAAGSAL